MHRMPVGLPKVCAGLCILLCLPVMQSVIKHLQRPPRLINRRSCRCHAGTSTLYSTLGISTTASNQEIKAAYRLLVKQWHPDLYYSDEEQAGAAERLQTINQAYEVLSDASSRQAYDMQLRILQEAEAAQSAAASQQGVTVNPAVQQALIQAVDRARHALQQAVEARLAAREAYRKAKQLRHDKTRKQRKTSHTKPAVPLTDTVDQTHSGVLQDTQAVDVTGSTLAQKLPPIAAKEVLNASRAEKQQQRRERRQLRKQATQARAWAQVAEARAAYQHMQIKAAVNQSVVTKDSDDDDDDDIQIFPDDLYASPGEWLWSADLHAAELNSRDANQNGRQSASSASRKAQSSAADTKTWPGIEEL